VSILFGINDTWRRYGGGEETAAAQFENGYRRLLDAVPATGTRLVLIDPFVLRSPGAAGLDRRPRPEDQGRRKSGGGLRRDSGAG